MGFDFSAVDADLAALGEVPSDALRLAQAYAGTLGALAQVDEMLSELGEPVELSALAHEPVALPRATPVSGELELPGMPYRESTSELSSSAELSLDGERPQSGSFLSERPEPESTFVLDDEDDESELSAFTPTALATNIHAQASVDSLHAQASVDSSLTSDDDAETEAVLSLFDEASGATAGQPSALAGLSDLFGAEDDPQPELLVSTDRDPDAEFEALFDEATHPSGIPTRGAEIEEETVSAEDLLSGLGAPGLRSERPAAADAFASALYGDAEDRTEILDGHTLKSITSSAPPRPDPFPPDDELGSSEFEIVLDENEPSPKPASAARPPTVPPAGEKRPSFLGRLFGRKDD